APGWPPRRGTRPPTLAEARRVSQQRKETRRAVVDAVRARSAGKSRAEVRQMLVEEFRASPLPPPPDPAIDVFTDSIVLPGGLTGAVRGVPSAGRAMGAAASDVRKIFQVFRNTARVRDAQGEDPYVVRPGQLPPEIEVTLDVGAEELLAARPGEPGTLVHTAHG
ncbi:MAG: hypothetical protein ACRDNF_07240, partial [Streptosporangiaceae bacterium]